MLNRCETVSGMHSADSDAQPHGREQFRTESDSLGKRLIPEGCLHGIHTARALENFQFAGRPVHRELIRAYGAVKLACARTNRTLGAWSAIPQLADALERACTEMMEGLLDQHVVVDALQGGAGTSTNMNVNEVLTNRALQLAGHAPGQYDLLSPLGDCNMHQSTNDTYPTALKCAAIRLLHVLERNIVALQEAFQAKEKQFARIVKVGRTELQDAVLVTLGREMGAYAEAMNRDRWRIYKCEERLRVINLGGTAIGTGVGAPRQFIFNVADTLREITGIGFARSENLIDGTQNADVFVEVSGILSACAASMHKIANDLRLLSSGPDAGLGEIRLPALQAGSSIMPGKVNPVIPEAVCQASMMVMGNNSTLTFAAASGNLELNQFMPLIAHCLLESIDLLINSADHLRRLCVEGIEVDEKRCREHIDGSTATVTALVGTLGYDIAADVAKGAKAEGKTIREFVIDHAILSGEEFDALVSPEAVCRLGHPTPRKGTV